MTGTGGTSPFRVSAKSTQSTKTPTLCNLFHSDGLDPFGLVGGKKTNTNPRELICLKFSQTERI